MKALILAAGYGTRLYPLVKDTPKALLEINNKPLINYIVEKLANIKELDEVFVVTNDKFLQHLEEWGKTVDSYPFSVKIVSDGTKSNDDRLGSIGDIDYVCKHCNIDDDFLVIGSDNLFDYELTGFIADALSHNESVSIGLYDIEQIEEATKFGVVALHDDGRIESFEEKPEKPKSSLIAMCLYYFPKPTLKFLDEYLKDTGKFDRAGDYIKWITQKSDVYGFTFTGRWYDIGSIESFNLAQKDFSH